MLGAFCTVGNFGVVSSAVAGGFSLAYVNFVMRGVEVAGGDFITCKATVGVFIVAAAEMAGDFVVVETVGV